ncbi:aminopeptidase [Nitzschia inconspicua]|uniref:Aminopeptidase n=1 Tax=Nitzschia inconspicua TaxID=303405 RepID=A0A9K3Q391_9STRA|nr:aminopeptidase [Nitzschia inconspicua]
MLDKSSKVAGRVLLPDYVKPERYDLKVTPDLIAYTFDGLVSIKMTTKDSFSDEESNKITLHAKELMFRSAKFQTEDGKIVAADEIHVNMKATTVTFIFSDSIPQSSSITLVIDFVGCLNNQMAGFYRSHYTDKNGNDKIVASTQFEALDARRAFPCVDEPAAKATFLLTLVVPADLECMSNMPESKRVTVNDNKVEVSFLESPKMSSYLLAWCIGEFDYVQAQTASGVLIKVYAPRGKAASCQYALDCGVKALDSFNDFFGVNYPLPKLDMVAIPEFAAGAMENWGLITYRLVDMLIDPATASNSQKQRVCTVVCHEIAHQWFGNLVTMTWWDDLWLNEGFASWAENYAAHEAFPDYQMWEQFVVDHLSRALKLDGLLSSHPIQVPIHHAEEVEQVFDAISYCKGGSVVRMIKAVLGMENFRKGLGNYMKKYAYGNTETLDLWQAWEEVSGMPVSEMMASWTEQMGFPLLKVLKEDWQDDKVVLELEQSWFLADGSDTPDDGKDKLWTIPILTCTSAGTQEDMVLMREKTASVTIPLRSKDDWVKLNAGQEVPMRVQYSEEMLSRLSKAVRTKEMKSSADRVGLIIDAYALVKANQMMSPESLIRLLSGYKDEEDCVVWQGLSDVLGGLEMVLSEDEKIFVNYQDFARSLVLPLVEKVGWEAKKDDAHLTSILRGIMVSLLCTFCSDDISVKQEAKRRSEAFLEDPTNVSVLPTDIKVPVFQIFLKSGGEKEYDAVKAYYYKTNDNAERKTVLNSLGSAEDEKLKVATLDWTTSGEIKLQDFFYAIGSVSRSGKKGRVISWKYFQDHHQRLKEMLGNSNPSLMDAVIVMSAGSFCSLEKAEEITKFFKDHPYPKNERKIAQMTENMRANGKFLTILQASDLSKPEFWSSL